MKHSLLQENHEIMQELLSLTQLCSSSASHPILSTCLTNFHKLSSDWQTFSSSLESSCAFSKSSSFKSLRKISQYSSSTQKIQQRLRRVESKEKSLIRSQRKTVGQLTIFPKLWRTNLKRLRQKSLSWRITPFASPQYDQEFSFMTTKKIENTEELRDDSVEFEKVMKEIEEKRKTEGASIDRSVSGWKSEYDSEYSVGCGDVNEIKHAISVLQKANLLQPESRPLLARISSMVKDPESSGNLALFLQLLNINNSVVPSVCEHKEDVRIEELLEATSFLSSLGLRGIDNSSMNISQDICDEYANMHKKTMSLGKNSTKDMTVKLNKN